MSRSRKRFPVIRPERVDKRSSNKKLRQNAYKLIKIPKGSTYKKLGTKDWNCSYLWTREQAIKEYEEDPWIKEKYSLSRWLNYWANSTIRK